MLYKNVCLEAIGYELAPEIVSSEEIEDRLSPLYERLSLPKGRLELMSGIKERRFWKTGDTPSSVAVRAGESALRKSGIDRSKIGALFHSSVCRNFLEPATASLEHLSLGLQKNTILFDISNACLGVIDAMVMIANMIELGQIKVGMAVAGEMGETLVNATIKKLNADMSLTRKSVKEHFASLTIGSGAVAVIMTHKDVSRSGHRLTGGVARCATGESTLCRSDSDGGFDADSAPLMATDSETLLKAGCALAKETFEFFKKETGWNEKNIDRSFTHQVGTAHRKLLYESIGLDINNDYATLSYLGNVGSVSLPITLGLGAEKGLIKPGDKVALLGIGSGLNSLILGLEW